ncbi:MAG: hypothetical protein LQ351_004280 [Letrouitia transgressa]|nr:MAG: hypothetical protein LQ351_004280 [Letrouitia transgressa]
MSNKIENIVSNPINGRGGDPGVQLHVKPAANGVVPISEMVTKRTDMLYGSYRAAFKYTKVAGTCGGFFWYYNDTNEIDVELLSSRRGSGNTSPVWLVIHSPSSPPAQEPQVPFHPDDGYHEYRFDWTPEKVSYYADGQHLGDVTTGLPTHPGRIHFNHWSNGDNGWTAGPPTADAVMSIAYVKAYFNTSSDDGTTQNKPTKCTDPTAPNAICEVPDLDGPLDLNQPTKFFTTSATGTEDGGASVSAPAVQSRTASSASSSSAAEPEQSTHAPTTQTSAGQRLYPRLLRPGLSTRVRKL